MASASKRYAKKDVQRIYKMAYEDELNWADLLPAPILRYLSLVRVVCAAPIEFSIICLLCTTSALCGPQTRMLCQPNGHETPLNLYALAISDPGGAKSSAYDNILTPAMEMFQKETGTRMVIESYTHAGMLAHLDVSGGYGLLASEEGIRVLSGIQGKQLKNEGERQFLCKTWGGKGDWTLLREKERGFSKTSLGILLFVQPQPLMAELRHLDGDDGLLDRFLFITAKPKWYTSAKISQKGEILKKDYNDPITKFARTVYEDHKAVSEDATTMYQFDNEAQELYNAITDQYVNDFNKQYETGKLNLN